MLKSSAKHQITTAIVMLFISFIVAMLSGCSAIQNKAMLFDDIGGKRGIARIYGKAVQKIYDDPQLFQYFRGVPKRHVQIMLSKQTCELIGGPCKYDGRSMKDVHKNLAITDDDFYLLVEYVQEAMREVGLTYQQESLILKHLAPLKADIVYQ